jgi:hypothetical protein
MHDLHLLYSHPGSMQHACCIVDKVHIKQINKNLQFTCQKQSRPVSQFARLRALPSGSIKQAALSQPEMAAGLGLGKS